MKKFYIISLLLLLPAMAKPCFDIGYGNEYWSYFMLREFNDDFEPDFLKFWNAYTGLNLDEYDLRLLTENSAINFDDYKIYAAAKKKNDSEMLEYLRLNNLYRQRRNNDYDFCSNLYKEAYGDDYDEEWNTWYYPTKEDLDKAKANLDEVITAARAYKGTKYADRYILLAMRAMFQSGQFDEVIKYYSQSLSRIPAGSDCLLLIDDLYAGALLRTGKKDEAIEIYAKINDNVSLSWCVAGKYEYETLMSVYNKNHNSKAIPWIVIQYIDNIEFELRRTEFYDKEDSLHNVATKRSAKDFIAQANKIADSKATDNPALWKSAAAYCNYCLGNLKDAKNQIDAAMSMAGSASVKENARMTRLLIYAADKNYTPDYANFMLAELKWLKSKVKADVESYIENFETIHNAIADKQLKAAVGGLHLTICKTDPTMYANSNGLGWFMSIDNPGKQDYSSRYFASLCELTAAETEDFYNKFATRDELSKWLWGQIEHDQDYFNDLIGTKYLAEGNYQKAIPFLQKVPLKFLDDQAIAKYMLYRTYEKPKWTGIQLEGSDVNNWFSEEEIELPPLGTNQKLDFCKDMVSLMAQASKPQNAYDIATLLYQASEKGDCWHLAHYFHSEYLIAQTTPSEIDFVKEARRYLETAATSNDPKLKEQALFALALTSVPDSYETRTYNYDTDKYETTVDRNNQNFKDFQRLYEFEKGRTPSTLVTECDSYDYFVRNYAK